MKKNTLVLAIVIILLSACSNRRIVLPSSMESISNSTENIPGEQTLIPIEFMPVSEEMIEGIGSSRSQKFLTNQSSEPILMTGDVVRVDVVGEEELSLELAVSGDGLIYYPLIDEIVVRGKTIEQVGRELSNSLTRYLVDPVVNVSVKTWRERKVYVYGASEKSSAVSLNPEETVTLSRLLIGMGVSRANTDLSDIHVIRQHSEGQKEIISVNLLRVLENFELSEDLVLQHNDLVALKDNPVIYIQGEVNLPGSVSFSIAGDMTLLGLLARSGGVKPSADLDQIKVIRGKGENSKILTTSARPKSGRTIYLQPKDIVIVSRLEEDYATVYGEVKRPGTVKLPDGHHSRLSTVLALSGGLTEYASSSISVFRYFDNGDTRKLHLDYDEVAAGQPDHDIEIQGGDIIYIESGIW